MQRTTLVLAGWFALIFLACSARAQLQPADPGTWIWQASTDGGATWRSDLVEVAPLTSLRIRALLGFPPGQRHYIGYQGFDAIVRHAGLLDSISDPRGGDIRGAMNMEIGRFGDILKFDFPGDTQPPGEGPSWVAVGYDPPQGIPVPQFLNPIVIFDYRLRVDLTPGDRIVSSIIAPQEGASYPSIIWYDLTPPWAGYYSPIVQHDLTVRVIPAPASLAVLIAACFSVRRRRAAC